MLIHWINRLSNCHMAVFHPRPSRHGSSLFNGLGIGISAKIFELLEMKKFCVTIISLPQWVSKTCTVYLSLDDPNQQRDLDKNVGQ